MEHPDETKEVWESRADIGCKAVNRTYKKSHKARLELEIINPLLKRVLAAVACNSPSWWRDS